MEKSLHVDFLGGPVKYFGPLLHAPVPVLYRAAALPQDSARFVVTHPLRKRQRATGFAARRKKKRRVLIFQTQTKKRQKMGERSMIS